VKTCSAAELYYDASNCVILPRKICREMDGKPHYYWTLVESYRTELDPRQRIVSYSGEVDEPGRLGVEYGAEGHPAIQELLFEGRQSMTPCGIVDRLVERSGWRLIPAGYTRN